MSNDLYEIRDYTIDPEWFEQYAEWARKHAAPWLAANLNVVGFWLHGGEPPVVGGSNPVVSPNGQPNVTWILRWQDRPTRDREYARAFGSDGWRAVWSKHPNPNAYLHSNARFMELLAS